jgi:hypothetical protein
VSRRRSFIEIAARHTPCGDFFTGAFAYSICNPKKLAG